MSDGMDEGVAAAIARLRRFMPHNKDAMAVCEYAEVAYLASLRLPTVASTAHTGVTLRAENKGVTLPVVTLQCKECERRKAQARDRVRRLRRKAAV